MKPLVSFVVNTRGSIPQLWGTRVPGRVRAKLKSRSPTMMGYTQYPARACKTRGMMYNKR